MDEQASGGTGTMILFIAMVLVAGTAASVLIQVANDLQQQAQDTANQALIGVSNGLEVIAVSGDRNLDGYESASASETIQVVTVTIRPQPGSKAIDLDHLIISITDGEKSSELVLNPSGTNGSHATATTFVYTTLRDSDATLSNGNVLNQGDLIKVFISSDSQATNMNLNPNNQVTFKLIPQAGIVPQERFTTPPAYTARIIALV